MASNNSTGGSLADRITAPDKPESNSTPKTMNAAAASFEPAAGSSWADEVNSPSTENPPELPTNTAPAPAAAAPDQSQPNIPQMDGATEPFNGSQLHEPDYAVEVKLADMQANPDNPLYSATSFEQLGLSVPHMQSSTMN